MGRDNLAGIGFFIAGHGIFQIGDEGIRPALQRLFEHAGLVAGDK
jgi:hypothetical protein